MVAKNGVIAGGNNIPWDCFRRDMEGAVVICEPDTLPPVHSEALPDQPTFVVEAGTEYVPDRGYRVDSFYWAFNAGARTGLTKACYFAGESTCQEGLAYCDRLLVVRLDRNIPDGKRFSECFKLPFWEEVGSETFSANIMGCSGTITEYRTRQPKLLVVYPRNARNVTYWADLVAINTTGICPFCKGGKTLLEQEIVLENEGWYALLNAHPSDKTYYQFLLIPKVVEGMFPWHPRYRRDLPDQVLGALLIDMEHKLKEKYGFTQSLLTCREGEEALLMGSSVLHLHAQLHVIKEGELLMLYFGIRALTDPIPEE